MIDKEKAVALGWTETPPDEAGSYWFYGDEEFGSMGGNFTGTIPPEYKLHYVEIHTISNGLMAITSGRFMSLDKFNPDKRASGHIGVWKKADLPELPI